MIDLLPEIKNRRSPLIFQNKKVPREKLAAVLEAARWAPSSYNHQPWRYIVIDKPMMLKKAHQGLARGNFWAQHAPVLILVLSKPEFDDRVGGKEYYLYDTGLSVMSLAIEAMHQGLSTHQMIGFKEDILKQEFTISDNWRVIVVVALGYAGDLKSFPKNIIARFGIQAFEKLRDRMVSPRTRKARKAIVSFNEFHF